MANQVDPATVGGAGLQREAGLSAAAFRDESGHGALTASANVAHLGPHPSFHGRRVSWVAVSIIMAGFLVGGLSLIFGSHGPTWWLFWAAVGVSVVGVLMMVATNTFEDWY
jgi:hypothetical protein